MKRIGAVLLLVALVACAGSWQNAARSSVVTLIDAWDFGMTALGSAYGAGALNENGKATAIRYGEIARNGLKAAAYAVDSGNLAEFEKNIREITAAIAELKELLANDRTSDRAVGAGGRTLSGAEGRHQSHPEGRGSFGRYVERQVDEAWEAQQRLFSGAESRLIAGRENRPATGLPGTSSGATLVSEVPHGHQSQIRGATGGSPTGHVDHGIADLETESGVGPADGDEAEKTGFVIEAGGATLLPVVRRQASASGGS